MHITVAERGIFSSFNQSGLLPSKPVLSVFEDDARQVWIGTQEGLVRLSRTPVSLLPLPGGSDPDLATISAGADGTIWALSSRVFRIRDGVARSYNFLDCRTFPCAAEAGLSRRCGPDLRLEPSAGR